jgi:transposase InsO family protein
MQPWQRKSRRRSIRKKAVMEAHAFPDVLHDEGVSCARKRVARLMHEQGLVAKRARHRTVTTHQEEGASVAPNLLQQDFHADHPNEKWTVDVRHVGAFEIPAKAGKGGSKIPLGCWLT